MSFSQLEFGAKLRGVCKVATENPLRSGGAGYFATERKRIFLAEALKGGGAGRIRTAD
jgi:hypothetical protein